MTVGVLLINLGTPASYKIKAVKRYLRTFLSDNRVIDLPFLLRQTLVNAVIVPFRSRQTAKAYQAIWTDEGSPLLVLSEQLKNQIQWQLGGNYQVALAMRYGEPGIKQALETLSLCNTLIVLPLYPQYASASTGSAIQKVINTIKNQWTLPNIHIQSHFYHYPAYIKAQCERIKMHFPLAQTNTHLLFSYHGIPLRQLQKEGCNTTCSTLCKTGIKPCYRTQCFSTSKQIAHTLGLMPDTYSTAFQSRLGKTPWIKPYTEETFGSLRQKDVHHLYIVCPSFVTDCLETLEEIGIRAKKTWFDLGGTGFTLIPCLNTTPSWVDALCDIIRSNIPASGKLKILNSMPVAD